MNSEGFKRRLKQIFKFHFEDFINNNLEPLNKLHYQYLLKPLQTYYMPLMQELYCNIDSTEFDEIYTKVII